MIKMLKSNLSVPILVQFNPWFEFLLSFVLEYGNV